MEEYEDDFNSQDVGSLLGDRPIPGALSAWLCAFISRHGPQW